MIEPEITSGAGVVNMPKYSVSVSRVLPPVYEYCEVEVEAEDEWKAVEDAIDSARLSGDWVINDANGEEYEYEVEDYEVLEDEK
jgi:hypothetical protein